MPLVAVIISGSGNRDFCTNGGTDRYRLFLDVPIAANTWHLAIVTQPGDGSGVTIHLDGVAYDADHAAATEQLFGSGSVDYWMSTPLTSSDSDPADNLYLGSNVGQNSEFEGRMQHAAVLTKVITPEEATALWDAIKDVRT